MTTRAFTARPRPRLAVLLRLMLRLAFALGLGVLASLTWVGTASANHYCQVNVAASYNVNEGGSVLLSATKHIAVSSA